jgi:Domain of unknown function (DUF5666)
MKMHPLMRSLGLCAPLGWARALAFTVTLVGCGGGVESGGTGVTPTTSSASGPITGFGSVVVNGVRFDDSSATVTDADGIARSRDDLRLGMTTDVQGSAITVDASGTSTGTAKSIVYGSDLLGPIDSIDVAGARLVALGQTVDIVSTTVFDDVSISGGLAALAVGNVIEVYSLFDAASGHYTATRIERKSGVTSYRLRGIVTNLDANAKAFNIGSERISYAGVPGPAPASLVNGNFVRVQLQPLKVGGVWLVVALKNGVGGPGDTDDARLEGLISAFSSATRFSVNGITVDASAANPPAGLGLGVRVEVEGSARGGVLAATKVKIKTPGDVGGQEFELHGPITSANAPQLSFVVRGVTVSYSAATEFRDGTAAGLGVGTSVEVRGTLSAEGTRLVAERITFK